MYSFFVGCDISKDYFDVSYYNSKEVVYLNRFSNDKKGFKAMVKALKQHTNEPQASWFFCFENTGVYSKSLFKWLDAKGIPCREGNALHISKSLGLRRAKDDVIDSKDICLYTYQRRDSIKPTEFPAPVFIQLKVLLGRRALLVKSKSALKVSLSEQRPIIELDLYKSLEQDNQQLQEMIKMQIKNLEQKIEHLIDSHSALLNNKKLIQSISGIGPIISAQLIVCTQNFSRFSDPRKFASYAGIAPFPNQSGKRRGVRKVSKMANRRIKKLLSSAAVVAVTHDPQIRAYFLKKIQQGKAKGCAYNNVKNKLIKRVFAVIKRQSPYVQLAH